MVIYLFAINENWTIVEVHQGVGLEEVVVDKLSNYAVLVFYLCMQQKLSQGNWQYPHIP